MSAMSGAHPLAAEARAWLVALQRCVRAVDYQGARHLFAPEVQGFGTHAAIAAGLEALEREQWQQIWPGIREFTFRLGEVRCAGGEELLGVIVPWDSLGVNPDGSSVPRPGRATLILTRRKGRWVAIHTHFSLAPSGR